MALMHKTAIAALITGFSFSGAFTATAQAGENSKNTHSPAPADGCALEGTAFAEAEKTENNSHRNAVRKTASSSLELLENLPSVSNPNYMCGGESGHRQSPAVSDL